MRLVFEQLLVTASVIGLMCSVQPAAAQEPKYCLQGAGWGYPGNCEFSSYQQCMATASGTGADCGINPRYAFAHQRRGWER